MAAAEGIDSRRAEEMGKEGRKQEGRKFQPFPPFTVNADREQRQKQRIIFSKQSIARG